MSTVPFVLAPTQYTMNRDDVESEEIQNTYKRAKQYTKCCRLIIALFVLSALGWIISLLVRHKYITKTLAEKDSTQLMLRAMLRNPHLTLTGDNYIKYFSRQGGDNPMSCKGFWCWSWEIPKRIICTIKNNAKPWDFQAAWRCDAECPDGFDLDTVQITCSTDPTVATNPHLGCSLVYSMRRWDGFLENIDWESLGFMILFLLMCVGLLIILVICASTSPPNTNGLNAIDVIACAACMNECGKIKCPQGGCPHGGGGGSHHSSTWG
jgi:hypothetical protein